MPDFDPKDPIGTRGAGKYDNECTALRQITGADAVAVIVIGGHKGGGCSVQVEEKYKDVIHNLPTVLEAMAIEMRRDLERNG